MESQFCTVMYVGRKKTGKYDSVNQDPARAWHGIGHIVEGIPRTQAHRLISHKDEFIDVTGWDDEKLAKRAEQAVAAADESLRQARAQGAKVIGGSGILLEHATTEQLQAELEKRKASADLSEAVIPGNEPTGVQKDAESLSGREKKDKAFLATRIPDAIEEVISKQEPGTIDDETGLPTKQALEEIIGFTLTEDDYLEQLGIEPDPA